MVTATNDGADGRVMVLRGVERATATLVFFTDLRAAKVAAIAAAPRVAVIAYDAAARRQLRLRGTAAVESSGVAVEAAWAGVPSAARHAYRTVAPPGTAALSPAAAADLAGDGRVHFARLVVIVDAIDWLDLAGPAHRRAGYRRIGPTWHGDWLTP